MLDRYIIYSYLQKMADLYGNVHQKPEEGPLRMLLHQLTDKYHRGILDRDQEKLERLIQVKNILLNSILCTDLRYALSVLNTIILLLNVICDQLNYFGLSHKSGYLFLCCLDDIIMNFFIWFAYLTLETPFKGIKLICSTHHII